MKRWFLLMCATALAWPALADTVYRVVDEDGTVRFSDRPTPGASAVRPAMPDVVSPPSGGLAAPTSSQSVSEARRAYRRFYIESPADKATIPPGYAGDIQVSVGVEPSLKDGDRVRLLLDGTPSQSAMRARVFMIAGVERGEHRIQAELIDEGGRVLRQSSPVTVFVKRAQVPPNSPAARAPVSGVRGANTP
ncbi:DUF4124 domain-containing protein [Larsenimonas suaedae]|uniref:DUF4124 domain-containing protein n=1 Tax=Larsenimonas suaedae TaxID=1851019 RepID=A0ABU1GRR6_9GAMM|nr:DUF4124 domain-containing protein [Larsenimonas suaedae]MCM2972488.1 DUF4124 domain-containing protein [Larsenimonas suaedae]MDR5894716.1 DUF4124 domain-containing protein [Larsenimonas suaedae]